MTQVVRQPYVTISHVMRGRPIVPESPANILLMPIAVPRFLMNQLAMATSSGIPRLMLIPVEQTTAQAK